MEMARFEGWSQGSDGQWVRRSCPHCGTTFARRLDNGVAENYSGQWRTARYAASTVWLGRKAELGFQIHGYICPSCDKLVADLHRIDDSEPGQTRIANILPLEPLFNERRVPQDVPDPIADDYREATRILGLSRKGSATLLRRCLQATLHHAFADMPRGDLFDELGWVIRETQLPPDLKSALSVVRKLGNFAAHPEKDGLAEVYSLDDEDLMTCCLILEALWDVVYVRPAATAAKIAAVTAKVFPPKLPPRTAGPSS